MKLTQKSENTSAISLYLPELDGLRFFAFLLVFIHHQGIFKNIPHLNIFHYYGWIGVDLFFSLSAFLFTKLLIFEYNKTQTISFKKFYIRRIFRIWPIYFIFILFSILILLFAFENGIIDQYILIRIIGLFTFTDNIMSVFYGNYNPLPYVGHLWTISFEEQFYIIVPIIILFLIHTTTKRRIFYFILFFILFNIIRFIFVFNNLSYLSLWVLPITHFESILFGIAIGFGSFDFIQNKVNPIYLGLISILSFISISWLTNITHISYVTLLSYFLIGISTSCALYSVLHSRSLKYFFSQPIFIFLGKRSYGLYVYHQLGIGLASKMVRNIDLLPSNGFASFVYSITFTIIASIISYYVIETPFLKWKKRFELINSRPI